MNTKLNKKTKTKMHTHVSGIAGEYSVAAELSKRHWIASLTMKNAKGVDILITDDEAKKTFAIQVKASQGNKKRWMLSEKAENMSSRNFFYVLVNFNHDLDKTEFHIVPSAVVAKKIKSDHKKWLETPGKKGQAHNDSKMRVFLDEKNIYLNRWDLLK